MRLIMKLAAFWCSSGYAALIDHFLIAESTFLLFKFYLKFMIHKM